MFKLKQSNASIVFKQNKYAPGAYLELCQLKKISCKKIAVKSH